MMSSENLLMAGGAHAQPNGCSILRLRRKCNQGVALAADGYGSEEDGEAPPGAPTLPLARQAPELPLGEQRDPVPLGSQSLDLHQLQARVPARRLQRVRPPAHD